MDVAQQSTISQNFLEITPIHKLSAIILCTLLHLCLLQLCCNAAGFQFCVQCGYMKQLQVIGKKGGMHKLRACMPIHSTTKMALDILVGWREFTFTLVRFFTPGGMQKQTDRGAVLRSRLELLLYMCAPQLYLLSIRNVLLYQLPTKLFCMHKRLALMYQNEDQSLYTNKTII